MFPISLFSLKSPIYIHTERERERERERGGWGGCSKRTLKLLCKNIIVSLPGWSVHHTFEIVFNEQLLIVEPVEQFLNNQLSCHSRWFFFLQCHVTT